MEGCGRKRSFGTSVGACRRAAAPTREIREKKERGRAVGGVRLEMPIGRELLLLTAERNDGIGKISRNPN